jgi:hypothetical protein
MASGRVAVAVSLLSSAMAVAGEKLKVASDEARLMLDVGLQAS